MGDFLVSRPARRLDHDQVPDPPDEPTINRHGLSGARHVMDVHRPDARQKPLVPFASRGLEDQSSHLGHHLHQEESGEKTPLVYPGVCGIDCPLSHDAARLELQDGVGQAGRAGVG